MIKLAHQLDTDGHSVRGLAITMPRMRQCEFYDRAFGTFDLHESDFMTVELELEKI